MTKEGNIGKALLATGFPYNRRQKVDSLSGLIHDSMLQIMQKNRHVDSPQGD